MKISEAERLICPMSFSGQQERKCATTDCMAWVARMNTYIVDNQYVGKKSIDEGYCELIRN